MSEEHNESSTRPEEGTVSDVEPETGRPRSSSYVGGMRSPMDAGGTERGGIFEPRIPQDNEGRTGKKLSQWGASSRRRSFWKNLYYKSAGPSGMQEIDE